MLPEWSKLWSHCQVIGRPRYGKTFFSVYCLRRHILAGNRVNYLGGGKDDAFDELIAFIAQANPEYPARFINVSDPRRVTAYNPFRLSKGRNLSAHVARMAEALLGNVSGQPISDLQNYAEVAEPFLAHLCTSNEPIHQATRLFEFSNRKRWAELSIPAQFQYQARSIAETDARSWEFKVGALRRRLRPFITSDAIRRVVCAPNPVSLSELYEQGISLLVKASPSAELSPESGRIILGFFLSDLLQVGIENAGRKKFFATYCDEIQQYAPPSMADILDTVLSSGLAFTLTHHHDAQFPERLRASVQNNVGIKVIFGGLSSDIRTALAEDAFHREINRRHHKQPRVTFLTEHYDDTRSSWSESDDGRTSFTESDYLHPYNEKVITGYDDFDRSEVVSRYASKFVLAKQECMVILPDQTYRLRIPTLRRYLPDSAETLHFLESLPGSISLDEANRLANIFERGPDATTKRTRKKSAPLFNAGR